MLTNKSILILCLFLILSIKINYAQETKILGQSEYVIGRIKDIIAINHSKDGDFETRMKVSTQFDNFNRFQNCYVNGVTTTDSWFGSIKYFDDKYVKPLKNQDTTNLAYVNVHDANGNDGGLKCYLKNDLLYCDNVMTYGKYGESGPVTNFSIYNSSKKLIFQQGYIYKKHEFLDLLTEIDNYSIGGKISFRTIFIYTA